MLRLTNSGSHSLELVTAQNGASVLVSWSDATSTDYVGGSTLTSVTSATTTTICATPAASTVRDIDQVNIKNTYAGAHSITLQMDMGGTNYPILTAVLDSDESLNYTHGSGWQILTATGSVKPGAVQSEINYQDFTPISAPTFVEGRLWYDADDNALSYYNDISASSLQIGFESWVRVRNSTGSTITNGSVVYISGASGQIPTIALADADVNTPSQVIGVVTADILNNDFGHVTTLGIVKGLDTSAFSDGDVVYLSQTAGQFTATPPTGDASVITVGVIAYSHVSQGRLFARVNDAKSYSYASKTETLTNKTLTSPDINGGTIDGTVIGGGVGGAAAGTFTTLTSTGNAALGDAEATDTHAIKGATTLLANSASAALTVTQTGAGNALVIEDSASPDSTPVVVDSAGRTMLGGTASVTSPNYAGTQQGDQIQIQNSGSYNGLSIQNYVAGSGGGHVSFSHSRSGTVGSQTAVLNNDYLGNLVFAGSDGTNFIRAAQIEARVDGTPGTNDMPGRLVFSTTKDGASSPTEALRIKSDQESWFQANNSTAAVTITQTGSGNALVVEDSTSPDSTPFVITGDGTVIKGNSTVITYSSSSGIIPGIQMNVAGAATVGISRWSANTASNALVFLKSRGATIGDFTAVQSNDNLGAVNFYGADGTAGIYAATITAAADGTPSTGIVPGRVTISTADSSGVMTEAMRIDSAQRVGIGVTPSGYQKLAVSGTYPTSSNTTEVVSMRGTIPSGSTTAATMVMSRPATEATTFTLADLYHFYVQPNTFGAGSTVTNQYGFAVNSSLTGATNNYGFYSNIASGTGRWNFYAAGTAANYFAGNTGIGGQTIDTERLRVVAVSGALSTPLTASDIFTTTAATFEAAGGTNVVIANTVTETGTLAFGRVGAWAAGSVSYDHATDQLKLAAGGDVALTCFNTGGVSITKTAVTAPAASDGNVFSGTYTPTLTNVTNIDSSTAVVCQYMRVGNTVTVSGAVVIDATATGDTVLRMSLPISSNFAGSQNCGGTFTNNGSAAMPVNVGGVYGDSTNDTANFRINSASTASTSYSFHFTYQVI